MIHSLCADECIDKEPVSALHTCVLSLGDFSTPLVAPQVVANSTLVATNFKNFQDALRLIVCHRRNYKVKFGLKGTNE